MFPVSHSLYYSFCFLLNGWVIELAALKFSREEGHRTSALAERVAARAISDASVSTSNGIRGRLLREPASRASISHQLYICESQIDHINKERSKTNYYFHNTEVQWHTNKRLSVSLYRKCTNTDHYLNAQSHHLNSIKDSVIFFLFNRAKSITSDSQDLNTERDRITRVIEANE